MRKDKAMVYQARMRLFETASIAFGGGSRIGLRRDLSQMELYKVWADADCDV